MSDVAPKATVGGLLAHEYIYAEAQRPVELEQRCSGTAAVVVALRTFALVSIQ